MTTTAPAPVVTAVTDAPRTEWRQLGRWLWVARRDGRHVGTVERGRRFVLTDATGRAAGEYRTLAEAIAAAEAAPADAGAGPVARAPRLSTAIAVASVLGGGVAMGAGALAVLAAR